MTAETLAQSEWAEWSSRLWDSMEERFGYPGLAWHEQLVIRSKKENRCARCGDPGTIRYDSRLIKSVSHYWLCDKCEEHYR